MDGTNKKLAVDSVFDHFHCRFIIIDCGSCPLLISFTYKSMAISLRRARQT